MKALFILCFHQDSIRTSLDCCSATLLVGLCGKQHEAELSNGKRHITKRNKRLASHIYSKHLEGNATMYGVTHKLRERVLPLQMFFTID